MSVRWGTAAAEREHAAGYREFRPDPLLAPYLACVWVSVTGAGAFAHTRHILPDGCADIILAGDAELSIVGPATRPVLALLPPGTSYIGVRFRPGMAPSLLGLPACELRDMRVPLREIWGRDETARLAGRIDQAGSTGAGLTAIQETLIARLPDAGASDQLVATAIDLLGQQPELRVQALSRALDISERQLRRRFDAAVGYGPKTFQRIVRLQRVLVCARQTPAERRDLSGLAFAAGYADQAHMTREFARLVGLSPAAYLHRNNQPTPYVRFIQDNLLPGSL